MVAGPDTATIAMKASASISSLRHTAATTSCLPSVVWNDGSSSVLRHEAHASKVPTSTRTRQESQAAAQAAQTRWKGRASLLRPSSQRAPQAMVPDKAWLSNACNVHSIAAHRSDGLSQRHHRKRDGGYKQHRLDVRHGLQPRLRKPVVNVVRGRSLAA